MKVGKDEPIAIAIIAVRVIPNASKTACENLSEDGVYRIRLQAPPEKGKANKALVHFLAKTLGLGRRAIELISGETARHKRLKIHGMTLDEIRDKLAPR